VRSRVRNSFDFLSVSALDLFASALGVFVLMAFVMLPFYLNRPSVDSAIAGAKAEIADLSAVLRLYRERLVAAAATRQEAEAQLLAAQRHLVAAREASPRPAAAVPEPPETVKPAKPGAIAIPPLDLMIVIDTTGSMRNGIRELQAGLLGIIRVLHRLSPSLAIGVIAYRDRDQAYLTRTYPLSRIDDGTIRGLLEFVSSLRAEAGGDTPEAVDAALEEAGRVAWRDQVLGRIVVIGDAPAHPPDWQRSFETIARFHASGRDGAERTVGAIYAGRDPEGRSFFERMARAGGGDFREHKGELMESILLSVLANAWRS
jgi:von Willebrand factor type A domain